MSESSTSKPGRMIVSLQVGGFFFALANIVCVIILAFTYLAAKHEPKTIEVKGSAKKSIESDMITWSGTMTARDADLTKAYDALKSDSDRVAAFLKEKGVPEGEITFSQISTEKVYEKELVNAASAAPSSTPTVVGNRVLVQTHKIEMYVLTQTVTIESHDMKKVPEVARSVSSLIKDDVEIDSGSPAYLYTKLSELKVDMLGEATKDATTRATQVVTNANGKLGKLVEARMGIMQINPKGSSATSAEGINDTTSLEKEITAVVTARFELE